MILSSDSHLVHNSAPETGFRSFPLIPVQVQPGACEVESHFHLKPLKTKQRNS